MKKGRVCSFLAALKKKKKKRRAKRRLETIGVISVAQASGLPGLSWAAVAGGCLTGSGQAAAEAAVISGVVPVTCLVPGMEGSDPWVSARGSPGVADFSRGRVATGSQPQSPRRTGRSLWPFLTQRGGPAAPVPRRSQRPRCKGEGRSLHVLLGRVWKNPWTCFTTSTGAEKQIPWG